jgi:phage tail sheath gpL-like
MATHRYTLVVTAGPDKFSQECGKQDKHTALRRGWFRLIGDLMSGIQRGGQVDVAVDEGTGGVAASQTVTYTAPAGAQTITIAGRQVNFNAGADATATALAAVAAIQADVQASRFVFASSAAGVVTLKAKTLPSAQAAANGMTLAATGTGAAVGGATFTGGTNATDAGFNL